jgi:predicted Zn-dependent peptidase
MTVEVTRLPSGLTVATETMPTIETAAVQVWVHAGSRLERPQEGGIAHVLEHMAFKGTTRRSAVEIKEELASVGGFISAATSTDDTIYGARTLKADVPLALDILSDILINPVFDPEELAREEGVIVHEIAARQDSPNGVTIERLLATAYPDQPLGRPIAGTPASVRSFSRESLIAYRARTYHAPNTVVTVAGAIEHAAVVAEVTARFAAMQPISVAKPAPGLFNPGTATIERTIEQLHFATALPGRPVTHSERRSLQIFSHILGGDMSSRLFHEAREKRGLCYAIGASHWEWGDTGLFVIYAATDPERITPLMEVIGHEARAATENISEVEVARAKAQFKSGMLMTMETAVARAGALAVDILVRGRPTTLQEFAADVDAVTVESVRAVGKDVLTRTPPAIAALGPRQGLDPVAASGNPFRQ